GRFGLSATRVGSLVWRVIRLVRPPRGGWSTQQVQQQQQQQQERLAPRGEGGRSRLCATGNMDRSLAEHSRASGTGTQQPTAKARGGKSSQVAAESSSASVEG
ncbi:unnamed protein product, partial [Ectocarpus sp. 4 AP-2014]